MTDMWEEILNLAISNGLFAVLFVALLLYQLKDSAAREKKYIETIDSLNIHLNIVEEIKEDIDEIKKSLTKKSKTKKMVVEEENEIEREDKKV